MSSAMVANENAVEENQQARGEEVVESTQSSVLIQDDFRKLRTRRMASKKSLRRFFGSSMHTDMCIAEVEKFGLSALLQSNVPLAFFLHFSLCNYNAENLFFYLEIEQFENYQFKDARSCKRTAQHLYDAFIRPGADFELNLGDNVRQPIQARINAHDQTCFTDARDHIISLMDFERFLMSEQWQELRDRLMVGKLRSSSLYPKDVRDQAVLKLVNFLMTQRESALDAPGERRMLLLREMIHDFCKTRLRCDFHDKVKGDEEIKVNDHDDSGKKNEKTIVCQQSPSNAPAEDVKRLKA